MSGFDLEPRRVIFRASESYHSIREQILHRSWCSKFFPTFQKNIFSVDEKFFEIFWVKKIILKFSKILTKFIKENFRWKFSFRNLVRIFENSEIIFFDPKNSKIFFVDRKNIFWKRWDFFRNINIEVKFHCGSNGSTPSLWKSL